MHSLSDIFQGHEDQEPSLRLRRELGVLELTTGALEGRGIRDTLRELTLVVAVDAVDAEVDVELLDVEATEAGRGMREGQGEAASGLYSSMVCSTSTNNRLVRSIL